MIDLDEILVTTLIRLQKHFSFSCCFFLLSESRHAVQLELAPADRHHSQQQQHSLTSALTHGGETKGDCAREPPPCCVFHLMHRLSNWASPACSLEDARRRKNRRSADDCSRSSWREKLSKCKKQNTFPLYSQLFESNLGILPFLLLTFQLHPNYLSSQNVDI